jgi:hypothetical protein
MGVIIPQVLTEDRVSGAQIVDGSLRFDSGKSHYLSRTPISGIFHRRSSIRPIILWIHRPTHKYLET